MVLKEVTVQKGAKFQGAILIKNLSFSTFHCENRLISILCTHSKS